MDDSHRFHRLLHIVHAEYRSTLHQCDCVYDGGAIECFFYADTKALMNHALATDSYQDKACSWSSLFSTW